MTTPLLNALNLPRGVICAIGAGGKKSLLYAIADEWPGTVACTTTVHSTIPPRRTGIEVITAPADDLLARAAEPSGARQRGFFQPAAKRGRVAGLLPSQVETLHRVGQFDLTLVKADGARMRGIKAPRAGEPVLPDATALVLVVVSVAVIGQPLDENTAHRPERISALTGLSMGSTLRPAHLADLFAAEHGPLQGTAGLPVRIIINQVDNTERLRNAREAANSMLSQLSRIDDILLTRLASDVATEERVVERIFRHKMN